MKQKIISTIHNPKKVIAISLTLAVVIGMFGYIEINHKTNSQTISEDSNILNGNSLSAHNLTLGFLSGGRIKTVAVKAGDAVKKGQVLATLDAGNTEGALIQAKAAYATAQANYQKIINGATGAAIDVTKAAVHTAEINLAGVTAQQELLVKNAYRNLLNSTPEAVPDKPVSDYIAPIISGNYSKEAQGQIILSIYNTGNGTNFSAEGITVNNGGIVNTTTPQAIGDSGLYIKLPANFNAYTNVSRWIIEIPNRKAAHYVTNNNAYQAALETQTQIIKNSQAALDQAKTSLASLVAAARPEDVAIAQAQVENAKGAVQIAEASYKNTIIAAPTDGTIASVIISAGQIATPNTPAIEFINGASTNQTN
jgi:multidrug resistance efflux pump